MQRIIAVWRLRSQKLVFTNGCFDVLHRGHLAYLAEAASLGNRLIIGLNSDASVTRLKGEGRPVNPFADRAFALASLHVVDAVCGFEEDTPIEIIRAVMPDILVKGGDYNEEQIVGADLVKSAGGRIAIINFTEGYSTTSFLDKIRKKD
ncbi:MAG: D-glycero-beta-D-manno-heptose 1-phosphate adenylyltransferase [Bacteroidia bacterium]